MVKDMRVEEPDPEPSWPAVADLKVWVEAASSAEMFPDLIRWIQKCTNCKFLLCKIFFFFFFRC